MKDTGCLLDAEGCMVDQKVAWDMVVVVECPLGVAFKATLL